MERDLKQRIGKYSDLVLAGLVVGIVAMMVIPLPTIVLDVLITANIALAVTLLLVSIYVHNALRIAAFPSLLLITTLFRLGLNVSSTRLILLQADAGDVIHSFGNFVVAGNLVVGVIVFLILTIIQFVVIAKGSERVAEVAARFTLDAMPGKQMAIDSDLRGGAIDLDVARKMRGELQRESQLYGSMDGAMKFVKGDAIAGILITLINIIGGLLIGVLQRDMNAGEAGRVYLLLTIGDGLVSQIPALLISVAAGIVVTRVASEDEGSHLGQDIGEQLLAQPKAIALTAGLLVLLAMVPGMPTLPFLALAVAAGALAYGLRRRPRRRHRRRVDGRQQANALEVADEELALASVVALELGSEIGDTIEGEEGAGRLMTELIPGLREMLHADLGVMLPGVHLRGADDLEPCAYRILLSEVPMASGVLELDSILALASAETLRDLGFAEALAVDAPGVATPCFRLPVSEAAALGDAGVPLVDPATQMTLHLGLLARTYAYEFIGIQETQNLLDGLERAHPALVNEVIPRLVSIQTITDVLRRLVEEGISIRNLREILHSLAEWAPSEKDTVALTEHVRASLKRYISHKFAGEMGLLRAYLLDPAIEDAIRESIQRTSKGSYLAMEPELSRDIVSAVSKEVARHSPADPLPVMLTNVDIRRYVRRLIETDLPDLSVLSFNELQPAVNVQPVARIGI